MKHMKIASILFGSLMTMSLSVQVWAQSADLAFKAYKDQVHSITNVRCGVCHGVNQNPLHSLPQAEKAYPIAKGLVNFSSVENSRLWIRSMNGHCGIPERCGFKDDKLLAGLKSWAAAEIKSANTQMSATSSMHTSSAMNAGMGTGSTGTSTSTNNGASTASGNNSSNTTASGAVSQTQALLPGSDQFTSWAVIKNDFKENEMRKINFKGPSNELYTLDMMLKPGGVFYFHNPQFNMVQTDTALSGFILESTNLELRSQNFEYAQFIMRPTKELTLLTQQGYVMAIQPSQKEDLKLRLKILDYKNKLDTKAIISMRKSGYLRPESQILNKAKIIQVSSGNAHNCVLFEDGTIKCWGSNNHGNLGVQGEPAFASRGQIGNLPGDLAKLKPIFPNQKAIQVSAGHYHTCALFQDKSIKCWGNNYYGQLGLGDNSELRGANYVGSQSEIKKLKPLFPTQKAIQVSAGGFHSCAVFEDKSIRCWGQHRYGQLGVAEIPELSGSDIVGQRPGDLAKLKSLFPNQNAIQISAGFSHTCAVFEDLSLKCWGVNSEGQLGLGKPQYSDQISIGDDPEEMKNLKPIFKSLKVIQVSAGSDHTCALFKDKSVRCWGRNVYGMNGISDGDYNLGETDQPTENLNIFKSLFPNQPARQVVASSKNTCVVFENGSLKCWGSAEGGLIAVGDNPALENRPQVGDRPGQLGALMPLFPDEKILGISSRYHTACALFDNYNIKCWGKNHAEQLGLGDQSYFNGRASVGDRPGDLSKLKPLVFEEVP